MCRTRNVPSRKRDQAVVRQVSGSLIGRAAVKLVEKLSGEPVRRVVFAKVVTQFLRHEVLVKFFRQVARSIRVGVESDEGVVGELLHNASQGLVNLGRPVFEIPAEEITLEKVADAEMAENAALFHRAEIVL